MNISMILLYVSTCMIGFGFVLYFLMILLGRSKSVSKSEGFDITKDIISEYNSINIIETKGYFTVYNIKRKVIKLATNCYYGKDLSAIAISLFEAGISVIDNKKNKYIDMLRNIISNLKILYILAIGAIFINHSSFNISDAKVSLIFILVFGVISYVLLDIKGQAFYWVSDNLSKINDITKNNCQKVINYMNKLLWCDKLIFLGEIMIVIRMLLLMLDII